MIRRCDMVMVEFPYTDAARSKVHPAVVSRIQAELAGIAEVSILEPVQEPKTGNPVKPSRGGGDAHGREVVIETEFGNLDANQVDRIGARVRTPEDDRLRRDTSHRQAVLFIQEDLKAGACGARPGVRQQVALHRLAPGRQGQSYLHPGPAAEKGPLPACHQRSPQIS
jgi:hypothetical protein